MTAGSPGGARHWWTRTVCTGFIAWSISLTTVYGQIVTAPRLRDGSPPAPNVEALGGGEVALELTIDSRGRVARVDRLRSTPPYDDELVRAVRAWHFEPATSQSQSRRATVASRVLLVALFRPPSLYAGPAPGAPPEVHRLPSARLPRIDSLVVPAYPPTAVGNASVLAEIELPKAPGPNVYRILSPASGFDDVALEALHEWRFSAPSATDVADPLFVYAVLGFRGPVVPTETRSP